MKSNYDIAARITELIQALWLERAVSQLVRSPTACQHHTWQPLDLRKEVAGRPNDRYNRIADAGKERAGLCLYPGDAGQPSLEFCEDLVDALKCPYFTPKLTPEAAYEAFRLDLSSTAWVNKNVPYLSALLWTLGVAPAPLTWWERLMAALTGVRPYRESPKECYATDFLPKLADLPMPRGRDVSA